MRGRVVLLLIGTRRNKMELLDITGNGVFNTLDIILIWCYGVTVFVFYNYIVKKVIKK